MLGLLARGDSYNRMNAYRTNSSPLLSNHVGICRYFSSPYLNISFRMPLTFILKMLKLQIYRFASQNGLWDLNGKFCWAIHNIEWITYKFTRNSEQKYHYFRWYSIDWISLIDRNYNYFTLIVSWMLLLFIRNSLKR